MDGTGSEELVQERLSTISGGGSEVLFDVLGSGEEEGIGVCGEEEAKIEGVGRGFVDRHVYFFGRCVCHFGVVVEL